MASIAAALNQDLKSLRQYTTETTTDTDTTTASSGGIITSCVFMPIEDSRKYDFANFPPQPYCWMDC